MTKPSDNLDWAAEVTQRELERSLEATLAKARTERKLTPKGLCYNCDEPVQGTFCDADCRDDYEYLQERRKANHV